MVPDTEAEKNRREYLVKKDGFRLDSKEGNYRAYR
jgi:hypothetical protein